MTRNQTAIQFSNNQDHYYSMYFDYTSFYSKVILRNQLNKQFHTPCGVVEGYPCGLGFLAVAAPAEGPGCCPCADSSKVSGCSICCDAWIFSTSFSDSFALVSDCLKETPYALHIICNSLFVYTVLWKIVPCCTSIAADVDGNSACWLKSLP